MRPLRLLAVLCCALGAAAAPADRAPAPFAAPGDASSAEVLQARAGELTARTHELRGKAFETIARMEAAREQLGRAGGEPDEAGRRAAAQAKVAEGRARLQAGDGAGAALLLDAAASRTAAGEVVLDPDVEMDLARALLGQRIYAPALEHYRRIAFGPARALREEAMVHAVECAAQLRRYAELSDLLSAAQKAWGDGALPAEARYRAGRAFYDRTDVPAEQRDPVALRLLGDVGSPYEIAAAYLRGALRVRSGDRDGAIRDFAECDRHAARDPRQADQRELCWLALARLNGARDNWSEAYYWYGQVPRGSRHRADADYEVAWTFERAGVAEGALRALADVPDAAPASPLSVDVALLRARTLAAAGRHAEATAAYQSAWRRFEPWRDAVDAARAADRDPAHYADLLLGRTVAAEPGLTLPGPVASWVEHSPEATRAAQVASDVELVRNDVATVRATGDRLRAAMAGDVPLALRERVAQVLQRAVEVDQEQERLAADARDLVAALGERAVVTARARLHRAVVVSERGVAQVALARTEEAQRAVQQLLFRRLVEDRLPGSSQRRSAIAGSLEAKGRAIDAEQRKVREEAIAQLEEYVRRHPDDPTYTPLAIARLGELHYQRAADSGEAIAAARPQPGTSAPPPAPATPRSAGCETTVSLYGRLAEGFPAYKQQDSLYVLLGYCLAAMGRTADAGRTYRQLLKVYPGSAHAPEAWVRLGDLEFDQGTPESLRRAAAAYEKLQARPDHPLFMHATYMLAWTWYRAGEMSKAVHGFTAVLDHAVAVEQRSGRQADPDLWSESVRYLAASYADPRWDGGAAARRWAGTGPPRRYEVAVYQALGDTLFDQGRFRDAVTAYQLLLARAPLAAEAPRVQAKVVQAWSRENERELEDRERAVFLATYDGQGSWARAHRDELQLLDEVRSLRTAQLRAGAAAARARAEALARRGDAAAARRAYADAEAVYARYFAAEQAPHDAYETTFEWAQCAFGAGELERAAELYERVRDDASGSNRRQAAALGAVVARAAEVEALQRTGALPRRELALAKDGRAPGPAEPLPAAHQELVRASDAFAEAFPNDAQAPAIAYRAAETFYRYGDVEEARRRAREVVERWPSSAAAVTAANLAVETHLAAKDWAAVEKTSAEMRSRVARDDPRAGASLRDLELGGRFERALGLMRDETWSQAAELFLTIAASAPTHAFADKALYNAAQSLEKDGRSFEAADVYRRLAAEHGASQYAAEASFRAGFIAESVYDLERALEDYRAVVERHAQAPQRQAALYNSARVLQELQRPEDAAAAFARYAKLFPRASDASAAQLAAARLLREAGDGRRSLESLRDLQRAFASAGAADDVVEGRLLAGQIRADAGDERGAAAELAAAVAEFGRRQLDPAAHPRAAAAAAEAHFHLAELDLRRFERMALPATADARRVGRALEAMIAELRKLTARYRALDQYRRPEWIVAGAHREAYLLERLAQALYEAPPPPELRRPGKEAYLAAYQDQLGAAAQPYREQAIERYEKAYALAAELKVASPWTRRTAEALARWKPRQYATPRHLDVRPLDGALERLGAAADRVSATEAAARSRLRSAPGDVAARVELAVVAQATHRVELARAILADAVQLDGKGAAAWNRVGLLDHSAGHAQDALEAWRRAAELAPGDGEIQTNHGLALARADRFAEATRVLERAVELAPASATAWIGLGNARVGSASWDEADAAYERALAVDAGRADAWLGRGVLHLSAAERSSDPDEVVRRLGKAIEYLDRAAAGAADATARAYRKQAEARLERELRRGAQRPPTAATKPDDGRAVEGAPKEAESL